MVSILIDNDVLLRTYQLEDAANLFAAIDLSRKHLRSWLNWVDNTTKPDHTVQFLQQSMQQLNNQEGLALGIFYKQRIIGGIGMHNWNHNLKKAELGYWIAKESEGKGIIHNCLLRFIDFLFDKVQLNKLEIHFIKENQRSAKVAQNLHFQTEGVLRQSFWHNGKLEDIIITGLLRSEWKALKQTAW